MSEGKPRSLKSIFVIGAAAAGSAAWLCGRLEGGSSGALKVIVYAASFLLVYGVLSVLNRHIHISITLRPRKPEDTTGMSPKAARAFLLGALFLVPLGVILDPPKDKKAPSLSSVIEAGEKKAREEKKAAKAPGYKTEDRARIGRLSRGEEDVKHD